MVVKKKVTKKELELQSLAMGLHDVETRKKNLEEESKGLRVKIRSKMQTGTYLDIGGFPVLVAVHSDTPKFDVQYMKKILKNAFVDCVNVSVTKIRKFKGKKADDFILEHANDWTGKDYVQWIERGKFEEYKEKYLTKPKRDINL